MSRIPNFFIVGAPKAGTTSLYHYLGQHPQVYMSPIKEPNFFTDEVRPENCEPWLRRRMTRENRVLRKFLSGPMREKRFGGIIATWEDYVRLFANATNELAVGEASVCYLWSPTAADRIANRIPDAKILVMLRDPVERAFSQYLQVFGSGEVGWSLREHIRRNQHHRSKQFCHYYPFLEFGLYSTQLERYLKRFGPNVWVGFHEDFRARPREMLGSICQFLGVNTEFAPDMVRNHMEAQVPDWAAARWLKRVGVWRVAASVMPPNLRPRIRRALIRKAEASPMDPADRRVLIDFYREDVELLSRILGRKLDGWLQPDHLPVARRGDLAERHIS